MKKISAELHMSGKLYMEDMNNKKKEKKNNYYNMKKSKLNVMKSSYCMSPHTNSKRQQQHNNFKHVSKQLSCFCGGGC